MMARRSEIHGRTKKPANGWMEYSMIYRSQENMN